MTGPTEATTGLDRFRWWLRVLIGLEVFPRWRPWQRSDPAPWPMPSAKDRRADAIFASYIEVTERAAIPCVMCDDIGEPHACERAYWQQLLDHLHGLDCADPECECLGTRPLGMIQPQPFPQR